MRRGMVLALIVASVVCLSAVLAQASQNHASGNGYSVALSGGYMGSQLFVASLSGDAATLDWYYGWYDDIVSPGDTEWGSCISHRASQYFAAPPGGAVLEPRVAVDGSGDVYVAMTVMGPVNEDGPQISEMWVGRFHPTLEGNPSRFALKLIWYRQFRAAADNFYNIVRGFVVDPQGRSVVLSDCGRHVLGPGGSLFTAFGAAVTFLTPDGVISRQDAPSGTVGGGNDEYAADIALDPQGGVAWVINRMIGDQWTHARCFRTALDDDAAVAWGVRDLACTHASAVAVHHTGAVYVTGWRQQPQPGTQPMDIVTQRLSPSGNDDWFRTHDGGLGSDDFGFDVDTDGPGRAYVAGSASVTQGGRSAIHLIYSADGSLLETRVSPRSSSYDEEWRVVAVGRNCQPWSGTDRKVGSHRQAQITSGGDKAVTGSTGTTFISGRHTYPTPWPHTTVTEAYPIASSGLRRHIFPPGPQQVGFYWLVEDILDKSSVSIRVVRPDGSVALDDTWMYYDGYQDSAPFSKFFDMDLNQTGVWHAQVWGKDVEFTVSETSCRIGGYSVAVNWVPQTTFSRGVQRVDLDYQVFDLLPATTFRVRYLRPDGTAAVERSWVHSGSTYSDRWYEFVESYVDLNSVGTWRIAMDVDGTQRIDAPFEVTATPMPTSVADYYISSGDGVRKTYFRTGVELVQFNFRLLNLHPGTKCRWRYVRLDGTPAVDYSYTHTGDYCADGWFYFNWWVDLDALGTWHALMDLNGVQVIDTTFYVAASPAKVTGYEVIDDTLAPRTTFERRPTEWVCLRWYLENLAPGTSFVLQCRRPDDTIAFDGRWTYDGPFYRYAYWWWGDDDLDLSVTGTWHYTLDMNGQRVVNAPFEVVPVTADAQDLSLDQNTSKAITLTGSDPLGHQLTYTIVDGPNHGTLTGDPPNVTYRPNANYHGPDSFTFKAVCTEGSKSDPATVSITVIPVNDAPVAAPDAYSVQHDQALSVGAPGVLGNDTDVDGDTLTAVLVGGPSHGTVTLNADGSFTYQPAAGYYGSDSFTYRARSGTVESEVATVSIAVTAPRITVRYAGLTRNADGTIGLTLTVGNAGNGPASDVTLTAMTLGKATKPDTPTLPANLGSLDPTKSVPVNVQFPASTGSKGTATALRVSGEFTGGTFSASFRTTLP